MSLSSQPRPPIRQVILDRDGVLNRELESGWLVDPSQWRWEEGAQEALQLLTRAGVRISVVTNQSGIGRGVVAEEAVERLHRWLAAELETLGIELAEVLVCPHAPEAGCACRKPRPGLVEEALGRSNIPRAEAILIGDDQRDLEAGRAAGVRVALVCTGKGAGIRDRLDSEALVFENLLDAAEWCAGDRSCLDRPEPRGREA